MASALYDTGRNEFAKGYFKWRASGGDPFNCSLVKTTYTPNAATHTLYTDITTGSYLVGTTGPLTLIDPTAGVCDANDITYSTVTGAAVDKVVLYILATVDSVVNPLMCWIEFSSVTPNGGDITIQWDSGSNKIFKL